MKGRRKHTEVEFDLLAVRKLKRLTKRVIRGLEEMEKHMLKMQRADKDSQNPSREELDLTTQTYRAAAEFREAHEPRPASEPEGPHPLVEEER